MPKIITHLYANVIKLIKKNLFKIECKNDLIKG